MDCFVFSSPKLVTSWFWAKSCPLWLLAFFISFMLAQLTFWPLILSKGFLQQALQTV